MQVHPFLRPLPICSSSSRRRWYPRFGQLPSQYGKSCSSPAAPSNVLEHDTNSLPLLLPRRQVIASVAVMKRAPSLGMSTILGESRLLPIRHRFRCQPTSCFQYQPRPQAATCLVSASVHMFCTLSRSKHWFRFRARIIHVSNFIQLSLTGPLMAVLCVGRGYVSLSKSCTLTLNAKLCGLLIFCCCFHSLVSYNPAPLARDFLFLVIALGCVVYSGCVCVVSVFCLSP